MRASVEQTKEELLDLRNKARLAGSRLLIVVVPALRSVHRRAMRNSISYTQYFEDDFDMDRPYHWLREFGESAGLEILNRVETFREAHEAGDAPYLRNDMQFSAAGHRLFAGEIVRFLIDQHWTH